MEIFRRLIAFVALAACLYVGHIAAADYKEPQKILKQVPLVIITPQGEQVFLVELALSEEEKTRGLMHRTKLGEREGMLFDFMISQEITMWMKNTPLPLDMIFISSDGRITHIAENTVPFSLATIPSIQPARAVLELNAGSAKKFGLLRGQQVKNVLFGNLPVKS